MEIKTPIIPQKQTFTKIDAKHELNLEAICVFTAIGFFLGQDSYWKNEKVLSPASKHTFDTSGRLTNSESWFKWHYTPRDITFNQALEEFSVLFETIIKEQTDNKKVILPLSGGLDSRTQAVALKNWKADVFAYSYEFENGYPETKIAKQIANTCGFEFKKFKIPKGYLWNVIDELSELNQCYSDFTAPRQMAIENEFASMGDIFSLGHWGDILFDSFNLPEFSEADQVDILVNKLFKKGGLELAARLWDAWNLSGSFEDYFRERINSLLHQIKIEDTNAKLRAFKSLYWAPRWTSVNLSVFEEVRPISLPYYDNKMCEFICTVPEKYLSGRQIQIEYIKMRMPELAKITWQAQRPFNLYNYRYNKMPFNLPYRIYNKLKRVLNPKPFIQRNWELQFLGVENEKELKKRLFDNPDFEQLVSPEITKHFYDMFQNEDVVYYSHPVSMLLTLSLFAEISLNNKYKSENKEINFE